MYDDATRQRALDLLAAGWSKRAIAGELHVSRSAILDWTRGPVRSAAVARRIEGCFRCQGRPPSEPSSYVYVLAQYLGDGHLTTTSRVPVLRIAACLDYPEIAYEVLLRIARVRRSAPSFVAVSTSARLTYVQSYWMHWTCLLPQHGSGPKHRRPIELVPWQQRLVDEHPWQLIRGLLHSDGCRAVNRVRKGGRQYSYPRWFFSNKSTDILALLGRTLDSVGVEWRYNRWDSISVARRRSVALLDEHVGPKS